MEFGTQKRRDLVADPHELVESQVCDQVCDLDSVMEFGLNSMYDYLEYSVLLRSNNTLVFVHGNKYIGLTPTNAINVSATDIFPLNTAY